MATREKDTRRPRSTYLHEPLTLLVMFFSKVKCVIVLAMELHIWPDLRGKRFKVRIETGSFIMSFLPTPMGKKRDSRFVYSLGYILQFDIKIT